MGGGVLRRSTHTCIATDIADVVLGHRLTPGHRRHPKSKHGIALQDSRTNRDFKGGQRAGGKGGRKPAGPRGVCFQFLKGRCTFDHCKFAHDLTKGKSRNEEDAAKRTAAAANGTEGMGEAAPPTESTPVAALASVAAAAAAGGRPLELGTPVPPAAAAAAVSTAAASE